MTGDKVSNDRKLATNHRETANEPSECDYCTWLMKRFHYLPESTWLSHLAHIEESRQDKEQK